MGKYISPLGRVEKMIKFDMDVPYKGREQFHNYMPAININWTNVGGGGGAYLDKWGGGGV